MYSDVWGADGSGGQKMVQTAYHLIGPLSSLSFVVRIKNPTMV
jgi:hypothetical protein